MPRGLFALLIFIEALAVLGFLVWPKFQEFKNVSNQAKSIQETLKQREQYFAQLDQILRNLESRQEILQKFDQALPNKPDPDQLIYFLSLAAKNSGMLLQEIEGLAAASLQGGASAGQDQSNQLQLKEIRFAARLTGTYPSFKNFLREIENSARLFEVERISILPALTLTGAGFQQEASQTLRFEVGLKAHSY